MAEMINKLKNVFGFDDNDDYDEDYEYEEENVESLNVKEEASTRAIKPRQSKSNTLMGGGLIITVHEPLSYDEAPKIVDDLRESKAVVLNFEQLDVDVKRQIFDFVSGALYALDGKIQKVNKDIFVLAPEAIGIDGLKEELKNSGMFPW